MTSTSTEITDPRIEQAAQAYARTRNLRHACAVAGLSLAGHIQTIHKRYPELGRRISELLREQFDQADITAVDVLRELRRVAFQRIDDVVDPITGQPIPLHQLSDDAAATITAVDHEVRWETEGTGDEKSSVPITVTKIRRADKMAALGLLAKHFKLVGDEGDGVNALASALAERLDAGRRRAFAASSPAHEVEDARPYVRPVVDSTAPEPSTISSALPDTPPETQDANPW